VNSNRAYGPHAPWSEDPDESIFPIVLRRTADILADRLDHRASVLRNERVTTDEVCMEIRRQIAAAAMDDPIGAGDLAELLTELLMSRENVRRAV
jgi:hypothetical protein